MRVRYFIMILFLILSCEKEIFDNPVDPDTELGADEWAPTSLTIEILTDSDALLSWQKSEIEATGFKVERQDTTGGAFVEVGSSDTTIYTDTALLTGNEYLYQVCSYSGDNQSSYATSDIIVTTFPAPYGMTAVPQTDNKIELAWSDSTAYESGFVIERMNIVSDAFTVLDSTVENTYQDTTVTLGNEYVYKVGAYSQYNTSSYTDTALVKYWLDCLNIFGGDALEDACGVCDNNPSNDNTPLTGTCDCNAVPNGTATFDNCEICAGGNTGIVPCVQDCNDTWGGTDVEDNCGTCDSDSSNDCDMDCDGNWGGSLANDNCGVCGGDNTPLTGNCDCHGTPNGEAYIDGCDDCVGGLTEKEACANDCLGVLGGDAVYDHCNTCDNDPENDCLQDCAGSWGGDLVDDACGVCGGDNSPLTGNCDCNSTPDGTATFDNCGDCVGGTITLTACLKDCNDEWGGDAVEDECGVCEGDGVDATTSCCSNTGAGANGEVADCAGVCGGSSELSGCDNVCNSTAVVDCADVCGGTATTDNCGACDTDTSNDCVQDCAGAWGGTATTDNCGDCVGGDTGETACVQDCAGTWGGTEPDTDGDGICDIWETVTDIDGNTYATVLIGAQLWMAENLKTTKYKNDAAIPTGYSDSDWNNLSIGAYAVYDNNSSNVDIYGNLYNWYAVENQQLCMEGWHVPTITEFTILTDYLGGFEPAGGKMKEAGYEHWNSPNTGATNESGFTALPGGYICGECNSGESRDIGNTAYFWSSTAHTGGNLDGYKAWSRFLGYSFQPLEWRTSHKNEGYSIRCLKGVVDCAGVPGGSATVDNCGECVGGNTGATACVQDCNAEPNGTAYIDSCGDCVMVDTGINPCTQDCNGDWGGSAVEDCTGLCGGAYADCSVYDIDGNGYTTITIGTQEWLVQNLKVTHYRDGSEIPNITNNGGWGSLTTGAYAVYDDNLSNADVYGNLYNLYAADNQQVCMEGWHVPSDEEWTILTDYLGGESVAGGKMKETGTEHWCGNDSENCINEGATNESGFTGLPAGSRNHTGSDSFMGGSGIFWTSSPEEGNSIYTWWRYLSSGNSAVWRSYDSFVNYGFSIRCLAD